MIVIKIEIAILKRSIIFHQNKDKIIKNVDLYITDY